MSPGRVVNDSACPVSGSLESEAFDRDIFLASNSDALACAAIAAVAFQLLVSLWH